MASSKKYSSGKKPSKVVLSKAAPSKKLTTILSKEAEKSSSIKAEVYTGNPTQSHMARSSDIPKYHLITAEKVLGSSRRDSQIVINTFTSDSYGQSPTPMGWDTVISIQDVSSISMAHTSTNDSTSFYLKYEESILPNKAFERTIRVQWASGYSSNGSTSGKDFTILVPGLWSHYNAEPEGKLTPISNSFTRSCHSGESLNLKHEALYGPFPGQTSPANYFGGYVHMGYTKSIQNPGGILFPSENRFPEGQFNHGGVGGYGYFSGGLTKFTEGIIYDLDWKPSHNLKKLLETITDNSGWSGISVSEYRKAGEPIGGLGAVEQEYHILRTAFQALASLSPSVYGPYDQDFDFPWDVAAYSSIGEYCSNQSTPNPYNYQYSKFLTSNTFSSFYGGDGDGLSLRSIIMFAYNIPLCTGTPNYTIDGCTDPNNMAFWGYDADGDGIFEDCAGTAIPAAVQLDPNIAIWTPGSCCPDCINPDQDSGQYSPQPLTLNVEGTNPTTIGGTDGYIDVTIVDGGFDASGIPQGLPTGVANYTYVIQNTDAADTMCGNTAGLGVGSGAVANTSFTFGNSVPANANGGLLQTGTTATYAASAAQGYVPGGTSTSAPYGLGTTNSEGFREGNYKVYVFDASATVCLGQTRITLKDPTTTTGCGDSDALNYDSTVSISNNSICHYCDALNGELVVGQVSPSVLGPITSSSGSVVSITPPTNTTSTDSEITTTGISPSAAFQAYINNVVTGNTQNADYIVELYKWDSQDPTGNANFGTLSGFNAGTTIVGTAVNNQGAGWNGVNFTGFAYGYYSIKVYISDPDATVEIQQCYEIFDILNPVAACVDGGLATAIDGVIVSDSNLYFDDQSICSVVNDFCCDTPTFQQTTASTSCQPIYDSTITCSPSADSLIYTVEYNSTSSGWVTFSSPVTVMTFGSSYTTGLLVSMSSNMGFGEYRVVWTSIYSNAPDCTVTSNIINFIATYGCTDPLASNYDAGVSCDDGSCFYPILGCTDDLASNYNPNATVDNGTCIYPIYGCTDITASNYDANADTDDNSCIYLPCGCTDPLALNYGNNCAGTFVGTPPVCDDGCCQYCEDPAMLVTSSSTATTLVSPTGCLDNCDGTITLDVTSTTCTTYTVVSVYMFCGIVNQNISVIDNVSYSTGTTTLTNLCSAMWTIELEDCNGCQMTLDVSVPGSGAPCGCTDPAADNYCASCTIDDGSCEYCGCTDITAINYNPGATANCIPDTCIHPPLSPPCIPSSLPATLNNLEVCIAENGTDYYNKLVTGKSDDCSIMNVWKLILITYLLKKRGLDCIYNCADENTPDASDAYIPCFHLWRIGGPSTGLNDLDQVATNLANGTHQGTHSTVAMFEIGSTATLSPGDVIRHHNHPFNYWIFYGLQDGSPASINVAGLDPENASGNLSGYWGYCNDSMRYISNENNINYIDNFINFANTFCRDCKNDMTLGRGGLSKYEIDSMFGEFNNSNGIDEVNGIDI
jgi:hypothetical protein